MTLCSLTVHSDEIISIVHVCMMWIEKSVTRITVWLAE